MQSNENLSIILTNIFKKSLKKQLKVKNKSAYTRQIKLKHLKYI